MRAIESELRRRPRFGEPVRLEAERGMPDYMRDFLCKSLELAPVDRYEIEGLMALSDLWQTAYLPGDQALRDKPFMPAIPKCLIGAADIFAQIREGDMLLHHPYDSFDPVVHFVRQAAEDPKVLAIKATLYRTSGKNSPIVRALLTAAENEKQVAVIIELKARFDEENNIEWATRLERAGAHVVYALCEPKGARQDALGGARRRRRLAALHAFWNGQLQREDRAAVHRPEPLHVPRGARHRRRAALQRSHRLFKGHRLRRTVGGSRDLPSRAHRAHRPRNGARPRGTPGGDPRDFNAITEIDVVRGLYRASQAGVPIDLLCARNVRAAPGRLRRKREHPRAQHRGTLPRGTCASSSSKMAEIANTLIASADWMGRLLHRRVELAVPATRPVIAETLGSHVLTVLLSDNVKSRELQEDGSYRRLSPGPGEMPISYAQRIFLTQAQGLG